MRVLQNLIGNGIKYQEPKAKPEIRITSKKKDGLWHISVKDNGIGMKPEYCDKIFEPFKRLHAKNEYTGTGMGLAICRKIIEGFGGKIWAEAKPDEGSVFHFTIPASNSKTITKKERSRMKQIKTSLIQHATKNIRSLHQQPYRKTT